MRKIIIICVLAVIIQTSLVLGYFKLLPQKPVTHTVQEQKVVQTAPEYALDPYISQLADEVGIDKIELIKTKPYITSQKECGSNPDTLGCYGYRITIIDTIKTRDRYKQRVALAHEYLHYVWTKDRGVEPELLQVYNQNRAYFNMRLSTYFNAGMKVGDYQFYNELHSFVGTEVSDSKLPPKLLDHYKKYTNRSALPSYI